MAHTTLDRSRHADPRCERPGRWSGSDTHEDLESGRRARFDDARAVLEAARGLIERGWLQHGWYHSDQPRPRSLLERLRQAERPPELDDVRQACLVAAVAVAAHRGGARFDVLTDAGPALDLVWDALWESRGHRGSAVSGRSAAPAVRAARMHDLVRWNDSAGRTHADVLELLDRAISRGILGAVGAAAGQRPAPGSAG